MPLWTLNTEIALTTVDRAKQHLNIPDADTDYDDILTRFINEASQRLEKMTGRRLKARDYSGSNPEHHDGRMQNRLLAREWPINSVTELWFDSSSEFTDTTNIVDSGKYSIDDEKIGIVLHKGCRFPRGTRNIRLVYNGASVLFSGDTLGLVEEAETEGVYSPSIAAELVMVNNAANVPIDSDVLIAAHHGSGNSNSMEFIEAVSPQYVIFPSITTILR